MTDQSVNMKEAVEAFGAISEEIGYTRNGLPQLHLTSKYQFCDSSKTLHLALTLSTAANSAQVFIIFIQGS